MEGKSLHVERIRSVLAARPAGALVPSDKKIILDSWSRCVDLHKLEPERAIDIPFATGSELEHAKDELGEGYAIATEELAQLATSVETVGYTATICNHRGMTVLEGRGEASFPELDRLGSLWTEDVGGTNGVGTCLAERRFITVSVDQHFFAELSDTICNAVPLLDGTGDVWGALNVSTHRQVFAEDTNRLVAVLLQQAAERISNRLFVASFGGRHALLRYVVDGRHTCLLALDADQTIVQANPAARFHLGIGQTELNHVDLWRFFEKNVQMLRRGHVQHITLTDSRNGRSFAASLTPSVGETIQRPVQRARDVKDGAARLQVSLEECAGSDPVMLKNVRIVKRVVAADLPVLLLGETGAGKDTMAKAIHAEGPRSDGPFVSFNCAAVPETLIDSELFGYSAGAFTGARREGNAGRIVEADGGTLFLDEIGDMPYALQTRLLRVLETREVQPLGAGKSRPVDINVIAATNQNLEQMIRERRFREDLYYRLAGAVINIPPLRERKDVASLIDRAVETLTRGSGIQLSASARQRLLAYTWPGNIRELYHVIRRAVALADDEISADDLMLRDVPAAEPTVAEPAATKVDVEEGGVRDTVSRAERESISAAVESCNGDLEATAQMLGISRATLYRKLSRHGIKKR